MRSDGHHIKYNRIKCTDFVMRAKTETLELIAFDGFDVYDASGNIVLDENVRTNVFLAHQAKQIRKLMDAGYSPTLIMERYLEGVTATDSRCKSPDGNFDLDYFDKSRKMIFALIQIAGKLPRDAKEEAAS